MKDLKDKRLFLFDIDGVIKLGDTLIDGALDLFRLIQAHHGKSVFITNNSTKSNEAYVTYFRKLGFDVHADNFITALSVTLAYLKKFHKNDLLYVVGTSLMRQALQDNQLHITTQCEDDVDVLLLGYDSELTFDKVVDACKILQTKDVTYLATNMDLVCPAPFGFVPDCGAIANFIETATGKKPTFLGKPSPEIVRMAIAASGFSPSQTVVVGDRLYTDIACGINAGVATCAVLTGEIQEKDLQASDIKPTYVFRSVKEIYEFLNT